jgi:hypothetical protein
MPYQPKDTNKLGDSLDDQAERFLRQHYDGRQLRDMGILTVRRQDVVRRRESSLEALKERRPSQARDS